MSRAPRVGRPWAGCRVWARAALVVASDSLIPLPALLVSTASRSTAAPPAPEWVQFRCGRRGHDHDPRKTNCSEVRLPRVQLHGATGNALPQRRFAVLQRRLCHGAPQWRALPRRLWLRMPWLNLLRPLRVRFPWSCQPACTSSAAAAAAAMAGSVMAPTSALAGCRASCGLSRPAR